MSGPARRRQDQIWKMGRKWAPSSRKYNCPLTGTAWEAATGDALPVRVRLGTEPPDAGVAEGQNVLHLQWS